MYKMYQIHCSVAVKGFNVSLYVCVFLFNTNRRSSKICDRNKSKSNFKKINFLVIKYLTFNCIEYIVYIFILKLLQEKNCLHLKCENTVLYHSI